MAKLGNNSPPSPTKEVKKAAKPPSSEPQLMGQALNIPGSSIIEGSDEDGCENLGMGVYGPPGVGKTILSMTASQFWPKELPSPKPVTLHDTLHVAWDPDAGTGLKELGVIVPTINIKKLMRPLTKDEEELKKRGGKVRPHVRSILEALTFVNREQLLFAEYANAKYGRSYIIQDTVSWLNGQLEKWYVHGPGCPESKGGNRNTRQGWILLSGAHELFISYNIQTPSNIIYLFHATAMVENNETEEGRNQALKNKAAGLSDIVPQITGRSKNTYNSGTSCTFWLTARLNARGSYDRKLHTQEIGGALVKNRWQHSLSAEEPADLGALFRKIRAAYGK